MENTSQSGTRVPTTRSLDTQRGGPPHEVRPYRGGVFVTGKVDVSAPARSHTRPDP